MIRLQLILSLFVLVLFSACGGSDDASTAEQEAQSEVSALPASLARGTTQLNLEEYFMPFSLYVPDSNRGIPKIVETSYGETEIQVGKTFHIVVAEGGDLATTKSAIAEDLMYTVEIIEEGTDYILYKSSIKDSHLDPEFHFHAVKNVKGTDFEFHDFNNEGGYAESVARFMLESINHIIPNNSAS